MTHEDLRDEMGNLIISETKTQRASDRRRIVKEILDMTETFIEAPGPEGPWFYRSLQINRYQNEIWVHDVDGKPLEKLHVPKVEIDDKELIDRLMVKLNDLNEKSLEEL